MKAILTLDEDEIKKVKSHLRIVHKCPSLIFPNKSDVQIEISDVKDVVAMFVAGRIVPFNTKRRA